MAGRPRKVSKPSAVETLDKLFADVDPIDALILTAGFIAGTKGYTPISAMINVASGTSGAVGALYGIDPLLKTELSYVASLFGGVPGLIGSYFTLWAKPEEQKTQEEKDIMVKVGDTVAMGCIGMLEGYAVTRPGTIAGVGEIVKGVGAIIPG